MKTLTGLVLALAFCAVPALSGDECLSGNDCSNCCPLAKQANARLATGMEAVAVSKTIRNDFIATVLRNVEGI